MGAITGRASNCASAANAMREAPSSQAAPPSGAADGFEFEKIQIHPVAPAPEERALRSGDILLRRFHKNLNSP